MGHTDTARQPWIRPAVREISVTLDTAYSSGSDTDFHSGSTSG